jgi:signal transduction histidine kinase
MDKKIVVYRILQELLANTLKHAHAARVTVKLFFDNKHFHLDYGDDGAGFNPLTVKKGVGLESIKSRVGFYKGKVNIAATPGKGSKTIIQIPLT